MAGHWHRPGARGDGGHAADRRRADRPASGGGHFCAACVWSGVRLLRGAAGSSGKRRAAGGPAAAARGLPRQPALRRQLTCGNFLSRSRRRPSPAPPAQLPLREDLRTRLAWGLVYQLKPLTDAEKALYLRAEAGRRGLRLSDEVVWYLLNHLPRDLGSLHRVLEVLDRYSLASQRAVTLPLVREALSAAQDYANCLDKPARPE